MPIINFTDTSPEGKKKKAAIEAILPKEPIVAPDIDTQVLNTNRKRLIEMLKQEIEVYKAYPGKKRYEVDKFTPRNSRQCFMGQAFEYNGHGFEGWTSGDLHEYRKAVGTIEHSTWGDVTLLEIWGGDHFEKHQKMVKDVFRYCHGELKKMPKVNFYINPFYKNSESGTWDPDPDEIAQREYREHMIKVANYLEIRDRMKKAGVKHPLDLAVKAEDDPVKPKRIKF